LTIFKKFNQLAKFNYFNFFKKKKMSRQKSFDQIYLERKLAGEKYQIDKKMVKFNKQLKKIEKNRQTPAHWPYYFHCVYPGYQNAYYPETVRNFNFIYFYVFNQDLETG
jgi:hypothetical protein